MVLHPPSIAEGESYPFSLYSEPNSDADPVLRGGQVATSEFIQHSVPLPLYFKRSMLSAYARYLDGVVYRTGLGAAGRQARLIESGRVALLALFDEPDAREHLLATRRWTQRLLRSPGALSWSHLLHDLPRGTEVTDASVRCALFIAALGQTGCWAETSQRDLCWAALIHALGRTLTTTHFVADESQTLLPLVLAAGPISEQLYGALRFHREYRDGSGPEGLTNDQVPPAATYLGIAIYLEQSGVLTRSLVEMHRYLSENRIQLAALFGRTAVDGIISSITN